MSTKIKQISILGCGWLGLPLGLYLFEKNFMIKGSTTRKEKFDILKNNNILPYFIRFNPESQGENLESFFETDVLVINIPPGTRSKSPDFHPTQMKNIIHFIKKSPIKKVIYISSTSIYPDLNREIYEEDIQISEDVLNMPLWEAENLLRSLPIDLTILRCGGLMGYDRIPLKYFARKKGLKTAEIPVNFVHRDDVVSIISEIIVQNKWNEVFNVSAPKHPVRKDVYLKISKDLGYEMPEFITSEENFKIINSDKLIKALNYQFLYPDPLYFRYEL